MSGRTNILSPRRVHRTINRQAYEIIERNGGVGSVVLFGIEKKGIPLAEVLSRAIREATGQSLAVHPLDVAPFRDDMNSVEPQAVPGEPNAVDITDLNVVLVDDVLFTGRTVRAALDALIRYGRPASIQLAVLIDRGHREYPVQPTYVGKTIPTKYGERIEVVSADGGFSVYLQD